MSSAAPYPVMRIWSSPCWKSAIVSVPLMTGKFEPVRPGAAHQQVVPLPSVQHVIAVAAVEDELHPRGRQSGRNDGVIAAETVDDNRALVPIGVRDRQRRAEPAHGHAAGTASDRDDIVAGGAVDTAIRIRSERLR